MRSGGLRSIRVGDIDVAYRLEGAAGAPVVMLAHGLLTSHRTWEDVARRLQDDWRVLRFDLRGHGGTTAAPAPYSMAQLAQDAVGLLDALEIPRVHFVGLSLGGMLGQYLGAHHGSRFISLTLANTTSEQGAPDVWRQRIETASRLGVEPVVAGSLRRWFTQRVFRERMEVALQTQRYALETSLDGFLGCAGVVRDLSQRDLLTRIRIPTLVIAGRQDEATTEAEARVLAENIPGACIRLLDAAHQSAIECPEEFTRTWLDFQGELRPFKELT